MGYDTQTGVSAPYTPEEMLECCQEWFERFAPTSPCIDGVCREHLMLTSIKLTLATYCHENCRENTGKGDASHG